MRNARHVREAREDRKGETAHLTYVQFYLDDFAHDYASRPTYLTRASSCVTTAARSRYVAMRNARDRYPAILPIHPTVINPRRDEVVAREPRGSRARSTHGRMLIERSVNACLCMCVWEDCATVPRAYVRQCTTHARARNTTGLNILFSLLGQGGQPCHFDTGINDSVMHRPAARAFNAVTRSCNASYNGEPRVRSREGRS